MKLTILLFVVSTAVLGQVTNIFPPDGNTGIGTSNPHKKLDVQDQKPGGTLNIRFWNNTSNTNGTETRIDFPVFNGTSGLSIRSMGSSHGGYNVGTYDGWMHTSQRASYLHFSAGNASSSNVKHMTINRYGNIGIGTSTPDAKLTVKGDIHTQEVRVDMNGAVGPDFVFESDYDLRTLEETEQYIQINKHLPEIQSAKDMDQNGFELKEMNLRLLQKVEELTLYLIEQNKKIQVLQREMEALKK